MRQAGCRLEPMCARVMHAFPLRTVREVVHLLALISGATQEKLNTDKLAAEPSASVTLRWTLSAHPCAIVHLEIYYTDLELLIDCLKQCWPGCWREVLGQSGQPSQRRLQVSALCVSLNDFAIRPAVTCTWSISDARVHTGCTCRGLELAKTKEKSFVLWYCALRRQSWSGATHQLADLAVVLAFTRTFRACI